MDPSPPDIRSRQPFKIIWFLIAIIHLFIEAIFYSFYYVSPSARPVRAWTYRQSLTTSLLRTALSHATTLRYFPSLSLLRGSKAGRFHAVTPCCRPGLYTHMLASPASMPPETIGGTFYPTTPPVPLPLDSTIVLHFHGGSYIFGSGRALQCAFAANLLTSNIADFAFFPQYRLARRDEGYFPAALQDAITSYMWLVEVVGFEARNIIISGDGAGGALALGLVRWLGQQQVGLQNVPACLLWSPQLNLEGQIRKIVNPRIDPRTDFLDVRMLRWAAELYLGPRSGQPGHDLGREELAKSHYISPSRHPFATPIAIWIMVGKAEILRGTIVKFAETMSLAGGNTVSRYEVDAAPHNIFMMGKWLGWKEQAEDAAREARIWLRSKGWAGRN